MHIVDSAKRLVKYSWLLQVLVERDLKIRYRRSFLGYLWSVLNPLLMMIILTIFIIKTYVAKTKNYLS